MARRRGQIIDGWINLDKPAGVTSAAAVARLRRTLDARKIGHAGTLDPAATGILPVALGAATRTIPWLVNRAKTYEFTVRWGEARDTDDAEGEIIATSDVRPAADDILRVLESFIGEIEQMPPAYSALHVDGKRAYALARQGEMPALKARPVMIYQLDYAGSDEPDSAHFTMSCGKGAYVRAIARDLATTLGTVGHVVSLRRTAVGPFREAESISLDKTNELSHSPRLAEKLLPVEFALDDIPAIEIDLEAALRLRQGQSIPVPSGALPCGVDNHHSTTTEEEDAARETWRVMHGGNLVAIGRIEGENFRPRRVFNTQTEK